MKVVKNEGNWSILDGGKEVATIERRWRFNKSDAKVLWIGDKEICEVKNQKEAINKLKEIMKEGVKQE